MQEILSQKQDTTACPVVLIFKEGKVLLGFRNYKDKWNNISVWTVPGGRCDEGETIEETLRREVEEEIGIRDLNITDYLGEIPGAKEGDRVLVFKGDSQEEVILKEPEKFSEWRWFKVSEIPANFINPYLKEVIISQNTQT